MAAVARARSVADLSVPKAFVVYPGAASDRAQVIAAASALDAAARFLEGWSPGLEDAASVDLCVVERASGEAVRFEIDLDQGPETNPPGSR